MTIPRNPCGPQDPNIVSTCVLRWNRQDQVEEAVIAGALGKNAKASCTASLNLETLQWSKAREDQRQGYLGGNLIRFIFNNNSCKVQSRLAITTLNIRITHY